MKKIKHIVSGLCLLLAATACEKDFLETTSSNQIAQETFWKTEADATQAVNGIYNALLHEDSFGMFMFNDILTPIAAHTGGQGNYTNSLTFPDVNSTNDLAARRWRALYRGVYRANLALEKIPDMPINQPIKDRLIGEAKFLRALYYFYLVQYFGDVILFTANPGIEEARLPQMTRTPAAEVKAQVYQDLEEAYAALPVVYPKADVGRATKYAALALKGRAQLYDQNFAGAAQSFKEIIDAKAYALFPDYFGLFNYRNENNSEVIFDIQFSNVTGTGTGNTFEFYLGSREASSNGWSWMAPTVNLIDAYEMKDGLAYNQSPLFDKNKPYDNRDPRMDMTVIRPGATFRDKILSLNPANNGPKYIRYDQRPSPFRPGYLVRKALSDDATGANRDSPTNLILIRYADVLLMYAEAQNEVAGPDGGVYAAINQVRGRLGVGMPEIAAGKTADEMREIIRHERVVEMALEGHYFFDLKRWNLWDKVDLKVLRPASDTDIINRVNAQMNRVVFPHYYLLPIPQGDIDNNPLLEQNPGYL